MKSNYKHLLLRGYTVAAFIVMIAIGVIASIFKIQYKEGEELDDFAQRNFRLQTEVAERGNLYASDGDLLATTVTVHNIFLDLTVIKDDLFHAEIDALSDSLSSMFGKPSSYFKGRLTEERKRSEERRVGKECRSRWSKEN